MLSDQCVLNGVYSMKRWLQPKEAWGVEGKRSVAGEIRRQFRPKGHGGEMQNRICQLENCEQLWTTTKHYEEGNARVWSWRDRSTQATEGLMLGQGKWTSCYR